MSNATSSHGALFAMELDPEGAPGVFTTITDLVGNVGFGMGRPTTEVTPHQATVDHYVAAGRAVRPPWDLSANYVVGDETHEALRTHMIENTLFGVRFRGPGSTGPEDEIIASGYCTNWNQGNEAREGARSLEASFQPTGPWKVDGELIS